MFGRNEKGDTVPLREPAFWFGVTYAGEGFARSASWSTAYAADNATAPAHTAKILARARSSCDS